MHTDQKALAKAVEYLREGDMDSAHKIAQAQEGEPLADTIHAIIHRREGDYSNSLYWWHRVGPSAPPELASLYGSDSAAFVRRCQMASPGSAEAKECDDLQRRELDVLGTLCEAPTNA